MRYETFTLRGGRHFCRPASSLGSCGFHPFPWTLSSGKTAGQSIANFERIHAKHLKGIDLTTQENNDES